MKEKVISINEKKFAIDCITEGHRIDGRSLTESRKVSVKLGPSWGFAEVHFGQTHVIASTTTEAMTPTSDRPSEGSLSVLIELSPTSSETSARESLHQHQHQSGNNNSFSETKTAVDSFLRESRAVDTEALCILAGVKVWHVRVSVDVVHDEGNCTDVCMMAAMASLLHARRPDVSVKGKEVRLYSMDEREPVPLPVHHVPLSVSFIVLNDIKDKVDDVAVVDPVKVEEAVGNGGVSFSFNSQGEVCGVYKAGGVPLQPKTFAKCAGVAVGRVKELMSVLKDSLKDAAEEHPMATARPMLVNAEPSAVIRTEILIVDDDDGKDKDVPMSTWNAMKMPDEAPPVMGLGMKKEKEEEKQRVERSVGIAFGRKDDKQNVKKKGNSKNTIKTKRYEEVEMDTGHDTGYGKMEEDEDEEMSVDEKIDLPAIVDVDDDSNDEDSSDDDLTSAVISKRKRK